MSALPSAEFPAGEPLRLEAPEDIQGLVLRSATVREELGRCFEIELVLEGTPALKNPRGILGRALTLLLNLDGTRARYFHGLVSELRWLGAVDGRAQYQATLRPWVWFLSKTQNCRIFQQRSVPEIIAEVFGEHAFADFEQARLSGTYAPREFVVQYCESDLAFVSRLMEEHGLHFHFRHARDRHTLVLCDARAEHEPVKGYDVLPFQPPDAQRGEHLEYVDRWSAEHRVEPGKCVAQHFDFERPNGVLVARAADSASPPGLLEIFEYPALFTETQAGEALATSVLDQRQRLAERFEGHTNCRGLSCGHTFTLSLPKEDKGPSPNPAAEKSQRSYLMTASVTRIAAHDLVSTAGHSAQPLDPDLVSCEFDAQASDLPFVLERRTPRPRIFGAQTAVVAGPARQEIWTDAQGRVQLRFHWDRRRSGPEPASCWVRVSQLWAGAGFGGVHLPRVGDEVVVQFLDGDPDRPLVVGRVYNGTHEHPYDPGRSPHVSGIRSATVGGTLQNYNEICFEDRKGAELLRMQAERDLSLLVKHDRTNEIGGNDTLTVTGHRSVTVEGSLQMGVGAASSQAAGEAGQTLLVSTKSIELRCGKSVIRLEPERITLECDRSILSLTPEKVWAFSSAKAQLWLEDSASLRGPSGGEVRCEKGDVELLATMIKMNSP